MDFYGRQQQLVSLHQYSKDARAGKGSMTLLVGRRRVGKTTLIKEAYKDATDFFYFFVSRKSETLLTEEFVSTINQQLVIPDWANPQTIKDVLTFLLEESCKRPMTVVFDEFQDFVYIDKAIYSDLQNLWDTYKNKSKMHLIVCGSIYSIMCKLFENSKEPLFGRADRKIYLKPLSPIDIKAILSASKVYSANNLLTVYTITGGIPRYLELLHNAKAWIMHNILNTMLSEESFFINEGKDVLIDEFGKDYKTYFSILSLLASGKTSRSELESIMQVQSLGGFIEKLEDEFEIISKHKPILNKPNSKQIKYFIKDNFLNFWFRYFYKNQSAIEIGNYAYVKKEIEQDFSTYSGKYLEKLITELLAMSGDFNMVGSWWQSGNKNEIDIVAINEREKRILFCDIKLQAQKLNLEALKFNAQYLLQENPGYTAEYRGYGLDNLDSILLDK
jgi:AAA+ ATPase superfamily predicted ATPase